MLDIGVARLDIRPLVWAAAHEGGTMTRTINHRPRAGTLHLIDAENLAGDPFAARDETLEILDRYGHLARHAEDDLAFVAANPWLLKGIVFDLPFPARPRCASGPDGADLALLAEAPQEWVCRRFR